MRNGGLCTLLFLAFLSSAPHHSRLFLGREAQFFIKSWSPGTEPKEFNPIQTGMMKDARDDFLANSLPLIGLIDNDVPNRGTIDEICEHSTKSDQPFIIPCGNRQVGMLQHRPRITERPMLGPRSLAEQA